MSASVKTTATPAVEMEDFKKHVLEFKTIIHTNNPNIPSPKHLGVFLMCKCIPMMDAEGDYAFAWGWRVNDVIRYNLKEYETETNTYKKTHKMCVSKGDTTWFYDFKIKDGKMRRCIMTTEIWYKPNEHHNVSPIAYIFSQFMANGLHITKCKFEDI